MNKCRYKLFDRLMILCLVIYVVIRMFNVSLPKYIDIAIDVIAAISIVYILTDLVKGKLKKGP